MYRIAVARTGGVITPWVSNNDEEQVYYAQSMAEAVIEGARLGVAVTLPEPRTELSCLAVWAPIRIRQRLMEMCQYFFEVGTPLTMTDADALALTDVINEWCNAKNEEE